MTAIHVDRYMFTVAEVVAAILPNVGRARELEMRIDADGYVVVDIVAPADSTGRDPDDARTTEHEAKNGRDDALPPTDDDGFPGDTAAQPIRSQPQALPGPKEGEARGLCRTPLFRAFLEVKTEEAALGVLAKRCHVKQLSDLDRTRSNGMNLRHVVEEFEGWKLS